MQYYGMAHGACGLIQLLKHTAWYYSKWSTGLYCERARARKGFLDNLPTLAPVHMRCGNQVTCRQRQRHRDTERQRDREKERPRAEEEEIRLERCRY